ncbi:MAG: AsmA-like C-terminal region-containing protein [Lishizhenia sp.]
MKKEKTKKSWLRRILKWTGISFLLVLILLVLIPIFFKNQIKEMALEEANKMLLADVSLEDFDLTFISTFPNLTVELNGLTITGRNEFDKINLVNIKKAQATVGFWSVLQGDQIEINGIYLKEPYIDVRILESGLANYDIVKPDSVLAAEEIEAETSSFKLQLKEYTIKDGNIRYSDNQGNIFAHLEALNHSGKGDLTADIIDFETKTEIEALTFKMDGLNYLSEVKSDLLVNLLMEFNEKSSKFTLKENNIQLNAFNLSVDGYYEIFDGYDEMDFKLNTSKTSFKDLLSLIPTFYTMGYEKMATSGNLSLNALLKGRLDEINMPGWDANLNVSNASIAYPDLPEKIKNIDIKLASKFPGGNNLDKMTIDIDRFKADFAENTVNANLKMRNLISDPFIDAGIVAAVDLATLKQVVPMADGESYNGKLSSDINLIGNLSDLEKENYEAFKADGVLQIDQMVYRTPDLPEAVNIERMQFIFSPTNLNLASFSAKMGRNDFNASGKIDNYMAYLFRDEKLHGMFKYNSNYLNLDDLMSFTGEEENTTESTEVETYTDPLLIPNNIDFELSTQINSLVYDGLEINNVTGDIVLRNEQAILSNVKMNALGGNIALNGNYNTQNHTTPSLSFGYDLSQIDLNALTSNFLTIEKFAPIGKYAQGLIDSKFTLTTDLKPDFTPIYNTLNGNGSIYTNALQISGYKPLEKLSEVLKIGEVAKGNFKNIRASFLLEDGKLNVNPFPVKLGGGITSEISGFTTLEQDIDYKLALNIPKALIPQSFIDLAEKATAQITNVSGFKINAIPEIVNVDAFIVNKVSDPKIKTNFKEAIMEQAGGVKGAVKDIINTKITEAKDSVKTIVNNVKTEAKEEIEAKKKEILDQAQKQADAIVAEANKTANKVRDEAVKQAQNLMLEAGNNPIKKKAAEIAGNKLKEKAEKAALKIEQEGKEKADALMVTAREKANKLG